MAVEVLDHNPATGMTTNYSWDDSNKTFTLETVQSAAFIQSYLDQAKALRNDKSIKQRGIKQSWMHAAILPRGVMEKMFTEYHINPYKEPKAMLKVIQRDFPWLMTATGRYA